MTKGWTFVVCRMNRPSHPFHHQPIPRRSALVGIASVGVFLVSGCLGRDAPPDPIALTGEKYCDQCGMLIEAQPGPVGQTFFDDLRPSDRDGPAWFCSGACTYQYVFDREAEGYTSIVTYMTDYTSVDWQVSTENEMRFLSAHLEAETFARADDLTLVVGSELIGAMGPDLIGFSNPDEADGFAETYGGSLYAHNEVTPELVASLRG